MTLPTRGGGRVDLYAGSCSRCSSHQVATIHLGLPSPAGSSGPPAGIGRATLDRLRGFVRSPARALLDLAPGGVCLAVPVTRNAGGLLHRRFTLTGSRKNRRSLLCGTVPRVTPGCR